mmetsp:Transcript_50144/g.125043  ORF Transcript_50144/g.125043 Transcript_50144/m.125043 type:complete len:245 (-) Transcript_50144:416-1150(-)
MISLSCLLSWFRSTSASSADTHPSRRVRSSRSLSSSSCLRATMSTESSSSDTMRSWRRCVSFSVALSLSMASSALRAQLRSETSSLTSFAERAASCCCSGVPSLVAIASILDSSTDALSLVSASCSLRSSFSLVSLIAFCLCPSTVALSSRALLSSFITLLCFSLSSRYSCRSRLSSSLGTLDISTRWLSPSLTSAARLCRSSLPILSLSLCSWRAMSTTKRSYRERSSCSSSFLVRTMRSKTS